MKLVVISGMHRSGTSAVARVVNLLGVDLGAEERLMEAKPDNPTGFWENTGFSGFNDDLLGFLGGRWDDPPALLSGWERDERLDPWRDRAREVLDGEFSGEIGGWKDPRMSLLLPFWRTVAGIDPGVLVLRRPGEVAASLAARDGMEEETAAGLWLRYVVAARRNDPSAMVVRYDELMSDPRATVDRLVRHLGLAEPEDAVRGAIDEFLDGGLRHHAAEPAGGAEGALGLADTTYDAIAAGRDAALVDALAASIESIGLAGAVADLEASVARLETHRDDLVQQRDVAVAQRDEVIEERRRLRELVEEQRAALATAADRLDIKSSEMGRLEQSNARIGGELRAARLEIAELQSSLRNLEAQIEEMTRSPVARVKAWFSETTP